MLNNQDYKKLSDMVKETLEKQIIVRSQQENPDKTSKLDEEIEDLYLLLSKLLISTQERLSSTQIEQNISHLDQSNLLNINGVRVEFLQSLRNYYFSLSHAVNTAIQYTHNENPSQDKFDEVCILLRQSIDNLRSFYTNIKSQPEDNGLYPFEPVKDIYQTFRHLGYGNLGQDKRKISRDAMWKNWNSMRDALLADFDRSEPKEPVSRYLRK